jgi:WXG100 family type VII secretion target
MAGNSIRVNTDQVAQIASNIEGLNKRLTEELTNSKATIDQLANVWEGEAAQATISSFDEFAAKYFQNYEDIITQYVQFLRTNIEQGYFDTETQNTSLADAFK